MNGMVASFEVGFMQVNAQPFKNSCLEYPQRILRELEVCLPNIAAIKSDNFVNYVKVNTI